MTIEMGKAYTVRDGAPVRLLCLNGLREFPIVGIIDGNRP
jgi:hypothetical protein